MDGINIFFITLGVYFFISYYLVFFKDMHFTILLGYTYRNIRCLTDRKDINKRLGKILLILGVTFIATPVVYSSLDIVILGVVINLMYIYSVVNIFYIAQDINKGKYN